MSTIKRIAGGGLALLVLSACGALSPTTGQPSPSAQPSAVAVASPSAAPSALPSPEPAATTTVETPSLPSPSASIAPTEPAGGRITSAGRIAFTDDRDGNQDIYILNVDGSGEFRLTDNAAADVSAAWSPDGTRIVFMSTRDGDPEIYVMQDDGSAQTRLTTDAGIDTNPVWSPDGTRIAFVSDRDGNPDIFVMNADGSDPRNLTQHPERDYDPAWSPDGTRIVFASYRDTPADRPAANDLYVIQADGTQVTRLTNDLARNTAPDWSPDGARIAFEYFEGEGIVDGDIGGGEIYVINTDGTNQQRLNPGTTSGRQPSWSADGTRIAFASLRNETATFDIFTMNADGADPVQLSTSPANETEPTFAPDPNGAGATANFNGVSFRYDGAIADNVAGAIVPAGLYYDGSLPAFTELTLNNPGYTGNIKGTVRVFPVAELELLPDTYDATLAGLEPMPPINAGRILYVQEQPLAFANGSGKRAIVMYTQNATAFTNTDLFYSYQGLTDDGKYYVSVMLPVAAPGLPESMQAVLNNTFPAIPYDANNLDAFNASLLRFNEQMMPQLAALDAAAFTPSLNVLDDLIRSLNVQQP